MARTHQQPPPSKNTVVGEARIPHRGYLGSSRIEPASSSSKESTSFSDVDGEVSQHLKKLGRKDPTTKLKALTSLCLLFKKKSGKELAQIVPQWAFEYKRLVLDYNREVRWGTHDAMTSLVTTVGKDLVPHLTSLMGPWWFAQFDPIIEVSQAAKRSLEPAKLYKQKHLSRVEVIQNDPSGCTFTLGFDNLRSQSVTPPQWTMRNKDDRNRVLHSILSLCKMILPRFPKVVGVDVVEMALWAKENTSTATNQVNTQAGPGASVTVEKDLVSQAEKRTWRLFLARITHVFSSFLSNAQKHSYSL